MVATAAHRARRPLIKYACMYYSNWGALILARGASLQALGRIGGGDCAFLGDVVFWGGFANGLGGASPAQAETRTLFE